MIAAAGRGNARPRGVGADATASYGALQDGGEAPIRLDGAVSWPSGLYTSKVGGGPGTQMILPIAGMKHVHM